MVELGAAFSKESVTFPIAAVPGTNFLYAALEFWASIVSFTWSLRKV